MATDPAAVRVGLARAWLEPCVLCGTRPVGVVAAFVPEGDGRERFHVPAGKTRLVFYALCDGCFGRPDRELAVENVLEAQLRRSP